MRPRISISAVIAGLILVCEPVHSSRHATTSAADYFDIHGSDTVLVREASGTLMKARSDAEAILRDTVAPRISVYIVESREQFNRMARGGLPDWGVGCAIPSRNMIVIISPRAAEYDQPFAEITRHEWAHIALRHRIGKSYLPRFLDEGFAMRFANQWNSSFAITLAKAQVFGSTFPLKGIDKVNFFNSSQAQIAYAQSYQAVTHFLVEYGSESFGMLLDGLRDGLSLDYAFEGAIGADFEDYEREYDLHIKENYSWLLIFSDMWVLWLGLALLIVIGFILKKKRGRDIMKRWEEEEKYQSTDFDYEEGDPWD